MSWDIKLHTHVEIQVPLLSIDKHCIYLYFYSFTRKKQSLSMRETTVDNRTKSRSYTGWALVLRCVVHTQKASVCRGKGGGKNLSQIAPPSTLPSPTRFSLVLISRAKCLSLVSSHSLLTASHNLELRKSPLCPIKARLFPTLRHPDITCLLSWGVRGRSPEEVWSEKGEMPQGRASPSLHCGAKHSSRVTLPPHRSDLRRQSRPPGKQATGYIFR